MIELKRLTKAFSVKNETLIVLNDINLTIQSGKIFGIIGESGAGKSTLIRSLNLLERPTSGEVWVDGINVAQLSLAALRKQRRKIGMIFQQFNLLQSRTAYDNIALPLELEGKTKSEIQKAVRPLLEWMNLTTHQHHYPAQLSGGQKQRVAIARALVTQPSILLCDEPTSALDPKSTHSILNLLKDINQKLGVTIVLITHEMDVLKHSCDRAAVLDKGRLIEEGSVLELFAQPKTKVTQQLVQKYLHIELPARIQSKLHVQDRQHLSRIVRFTFIGEDSNKPFISYLVTQFNLTINIIQANIENIQNVIIGFTVCQLSGDNKDMDRALVYVAGTSIKAEIVGYV